MICPLCQSTLVAAVFDDHLRQAHRLFTYREVRRTLDDTLDAILVDLLTPRPEPRAWQALVRIGRSEHGADVDRFLADRLIRALARLDEDQRETVTRAVAPLIAAENSALVGVLAWSDAMAARRLALACLAHSPPPYDSRLRRAMRDLSTDSSLPAEARFDLIVAVLPNHEEKRGIALLAKLLEGQGPKQGLEFVGKLEQRTGPLAVLEHYRERVAQRERMRCPRCQSELLRSEMLVHLWQQHRLVLDGKRVREPWSIIEEWLDSAPAQQDPQLIERCRISADKIDPQNGKMRLLRLLQARGLSDLTSKHAVLADAREVHAGCCPACFAFVPVPREEPALAVKLWHDRLIAGGYRVRIDERGIRPQLEVSTPKETVYKGQEPHRPWTASGVASLYTSIVLLGAILCAMLWPPIFGAPWRPVVLLLFVAWMVYLGVRLARGGQAPLRERLLKFTWRMLVPELHSGGVVKAGDSAFAAGLSAWYSRAGRVDFPEDQLLELVRQAELGLAIRKVSAGHLAALIRLQIEQSAQRGADPVPLVVRHLGRCFHGKLPLSFAQELLEDWAASWWTPVNLARLRILVCDRAFEAGYEVQTLLDAGENAPALGTVLGTSAPRSLAALRLIWSMRPTRPWDRLGDIVTAFEIAGDPTRSEVFAEHADLLLYQEDPVKIATEANRDQYRPTSIQLTLAGVWLHDVIFSIPPRVFEVNMKKQGCEMILGRHVFFSASELDPLSRKLDRWFRWVFHEFLPQVDRVLQWKSPHRGALLRAWGAVPCPECGQYLLPRVGEVGIALEEKLPNR
jgi:hypothetical protein